ncbi:hypothetical protein BCL69_105411 [Nitrosomonas communis]|uniref:Uncharacterized protein n=1 Tax=Nitrosomonas communis TaxID=44574 RepID=A0A5D3Y9G9_9PROT|nr:hypothetical protein BCL69_105411 [Nitrosomonas communis]
MHEAGDQIKVRCLNLMKNKKMKARLRIIPVNFAVELPYLFVSQLIN